MIRFKGESARFPKKIDRKRQQDKKDQKDTAVSFILKYPEKWYFVFFHFYIFCSALSEKHPVKISTWAAHGFRFYEFFH